MCLYGGTGGTVRSGVKDMKMYAMVFMTVIVLAGSATADASRPVGDPVTVTFSADISLDEARRAALDAVSGTVIKEEYESKRGRQVYEFYIRKSDGSIYEVYVDAGSGKVVKIESKNRS